MPRNPNTVHIDGLRELNAAFKAAGKEAHKEVKDEFRKVAEPVRITAERHAGSRIRNIGTPWSAMRVGVTTKVVYVAPKKRGVKAGGSKRPNLAGLLMQRALEPALNDNAGRIEEAAGKALDTIGKDWARHG